MTQDYASLPRVSAQYLSNRKRWSRPQGMLWSDSPPVLSDGNYVPAAYESGINFGQVGSIGSLNYNRYITLSDHNRGEMAFSTARIEKSERMVNGTLRSYHTADKKTVSVSWTMLPSKSFSLYPSFDTVTGDNYNGEQYTADGGAGGADMLDWYNGHIGPFWVFLSYDAHARKTPTLQSKDNLNNYTEFLFMKITSFEYSVEKRSGVGAAFSGYDFWNVSVTLEEV